MLDLSQEVGPDLPPEPQLTTVGTAGISALQAYGGEQYKASLVARVKLHLGLWKYKLDEISNPRLLPFARDPSLRPDIHDVSILPGFLCHFLFSLMLFWLSRDNLKQGKPSSENNGSY